jgi:hypothetical protein
VSNEFQLKKENESLQEKLICMAMIQQKILSHEISDQENYRFRQNQQELDNIEAAIDYIENKINLLKQQLADQDI